MIDRMIRLPTLDEIESAATIVYRFMPPTPQYRWPQLERRAGRTLWVKHENHTPVGAFKVRGGLVYFDELKRAPHVPERVIAATRGNHGQSVAFAANHAGIAATIVVPKGNSSEKNAAMRALGAELVEYGDDFQESLEYAIARAREDGLHFVPSFHPALIRGAATLSLEFLRGAAPLRAVYVPIGLGSGICGVLAAREALGLQTEVVAVVAESAPAIALSLERDELTSAPAMTMADGMACRTPNAEAFDVLRRHRPRVVIVSDAQIADAMRMYFTDTHNLVEGAGAASLAAALTDPRRDRYDSVGIVLSGSNVDAEIYEPILRAERV
jgi:threonine dehydratase